MYLEKFKLDGKVAVVTGAAKGIGFAIADALSEAGAQVVLTDMNGVDVEASAQRLQDKGRKASALTLDVSNAMQVNLVAAEIIKTHGKVDVLVNNAGIAISFIPAEVMDDATWHKVIDVNLNGVFYCCRAFGRHMLGRGSGSIINLGSMSAEIVNYPQEQVNYNASKAGVHHLTRSLAAEWAGRGLRVNAVAPTYIETDLTKDVHERPAHVLKEWLDGTPMGRLGKPEEIASVVLFLASDAASLMTGSIVSVDGGYTCW